MTSSGAMGREELLSRKLNPGLRGLGRMEASISSVPCDIVGAIHARELLIGGIPGESELSLARFPEAVS